MKKKSFISLGIDMEDAMGKLEKLLSMIEKIIDRAEVAKEKVDSVQKGD